MMDLIDRHDVTDSIVELWANKPLGNPALSEICECIKRVPSVQPEWNNHTVACLLADMFDDTCACNYNDIDEWLPRKCEVIDSCPNPVGVACWEQFLKHRKENR